MKNKFISHGEKIAKIPHGEKTIPPCETKPKRPYTKRVRHPREIELEARCEVQAREIRYLKAKYGHMDSELLAARAAAVGKPLPYYYWVTDDDVVDYCAGHWLCHPTNRMFRLYLSHYGVYGRIQSAMHTLGEWPAIVAKARWVREFAGWRHPPVDGVYDAAGWLARVKKQPITVVGGYLTTNKTSAVIVPPAMIMLGNRFIGTAMSD